MLYHIKLTDKELNILISSLQTSSIDKGVIELLTNYLLSEKKTQEIQKEEHDKKNRIIIENIVSENLNDKEEVNTNENVKKASELHQKFFDDIVREIITEYFQTVESTKLYELFHTVYIMGIAFALSQVDIIEQPKDSFFAYDEINNIVRRVPEP